MARSTGPILATGGITLFNNVVVHNQSAQDNAHVVVGTLIAAGGLALLEHLSEPLAVGIAWIAFVSVLFVRINPNVPSPAESFVAWYNQK